MQTLSRELRRSLETAVRKARQVAEAGARQAIEQLAVRHHEPWGSLTPEQRKLRTGLRAHAKQLGDVRDERRGTQAIGRLVTECAYEHWHRMLFARFLAETELLIEPESGMAISLADCQELARERSEDWLELAADYAERMLPQIFRAGDPVLEVGLPPETRSALEDLMKALPREVFTADDSLGWVYQFWQAERKDDVNKSEKKIGAEELPAVTQLFTEDYMVLFLLHNTLGAWWAGRVLAKNPELAASAKSEDELRAACAVGGIDWTYLRFTKVPSPLMGEGEGGGEATIWRPAAGTFDGWPKAAKEITLLDPCMGSGHFLVFALPILAALRAEEEGLSPEAAIQAVLRDNLYGLEIDPRCTQIAAFNLALAAWRRVGYRALPALHLACSGLSLGVMKAEWLKLAERAAAASPIPPKTDLLGSEDNLFSDAMKRGFDRLYDLFARAPWLGSLIDPRGAEGDLIEHGFADLEPILARVMARAETPELSEMAVAAQGLAKASGILSGRFTLIATNVPYLGNNKQDDILKDHCGRVYAEAKADLATCFVERCLKFAAIGGSVSVVTPQSWLFLKTYRHLRRRLLEAVQWDFSVRLGPNAFHDMNWWAVTTALLCFSTQIPKPEHSFAATDVSSAKEPEDKALSILTAEIVSIFQNRQLSFPGCPIVFENVEQTQLLSAKVSAHYGSKPGQTPRVTRYFWEVPAIKSAHWRALESTPYKNGGYSGKAEVCLTLEEISRQKIVEFGVRGSEAWKKRGFVVSRMNTLPVSIYCGQFFDDNSYVLIPHEEDHLTAVYAFLESDDYRIEVRKRNQKVAVDTQAMVDVPFHLSHWQKVALERYPVGLPKPHTDDPTQWLFNGQPKSSESPLQVAVARLAGYRWPRETGSSFADCPALGPDGLEKHADRDGTVALSPVKGEPPAADRLTALLADAFGAEWSAAKLSGLLAEAGFAGKTLDDWLRDGFFERHCALFHQRPFVWHVWDGRRDGFHALVNYHRLAAPNGEGRRTLEKLLYSYLGDWIDRQRADQKAGVEGADARVAAAEQLKSELENILVGEPPYDIFVRWKPLHEQPIGWEPDINDGVRINIRPFMTAKPLGVRARGACILRVTPKIKWDKDRGKEPQRPKEDFPWFWGWSSDDPAQTNDFPGGRTFDGNRWNDLHYTTKKKHEARERTQGGKT